MMSTIPYKRIIVLILALILLIVLPVKSAQAPTREKPIPTDVKGMIAYYAEEYQVSAYQLEKTLFCESSLNPNAKNITSRERSYGVAQINLMAHTTITIEQATDPQFAIEWTAQQFAKGNAKIWTCWVKQFGK